MRMIYGVDAGDVYWAASDVGWVVGHSYIVYAPLLRGCTTRDVRGQAGRHAGCRRVLAGLRAARGEGAVHRAHRDARDQAAGPRGQAAARTTICRSWRRCSSPASAAIRRPRSGPPSCSASRWSITGGRPRPVGRSPAASANIGLFPFKPGSGGRPCPGYRPARAGRRGARGAAGTDRQPLRPPAAAARLRADAVAERRGLPHRLSRRTSPAGTAPAMPA